MTDHHEPLVPMRLRYGPPSLRRTAADAPPGTVLCVRCKVFRAPDAFGVNAAGDTFKTCAGCRAYAKKAQTEDRARRGPAGTRADNLRQKYKITPEDYDRLRAAQNYRCAICRTHQDDIVVVQRGRPRLDGQPTAEPFRLLVDHCHDSMRVRGLLCHGCNSAIGLLRNSPALARAAADYLDAAPDEPVLRNAEIT